MRYAFCCRRFLLQILKGDVITIDYVKAIENRDGINQTCLASNADIALLLQLSRFLSEMEPNMSFCNH